MTNLAIKRDVYRAAGAEMTALLHQPTHFSKGKNDYPWPYSTYAVYSIPSGKGLVGTDRPAASCQVGGPQETCDQSLGIALRWIWGHGDGNPVKCLWWSMNVARLFVRTRNVEHDNTLAAAIRRRGYAFVPGAQGV